MRVLGPALITNGQQKILRGGVELTVLRSAVYDWAAKLACVGDRFWVREAYIEFIPSQFGCPQNIGASVPGYGPHLFGELPEHLKPYKHLCRRKQHHGSTMSKDMSRATLEIVGGSSGGNGWVCYVHMGNASDLEAVA